MYIATFELDPVIEGVDADESESNLQDRKDDYEDAACDEADSSLRYLLELVLLSVG